KVNGIHFDSQYVLASLDVVSLFTNIPVDLAVNSIDRRWDYISAKTNIIQPLFYYRYVDDVILALPSNTIDDTLDTFNSLHNRLQFTVEVGTNNKLSFLDTMLIIDNQRIIFDIYHEKTFSGRFFNFHSNHPLYHKKGTTISFIDKIIHLSYPRFHQKNLFKFFLIIVILSPSFSP
ncbi:hypothetical protein ALC60_12372, partial [Trachymyrmex zeteki]